MQELEKHGNNLININLEVLSCFWHKEPPDIIADIRGFIYLQDPSLIQCDNSGETVSKPDI